MQNDEDIIMPALFGVFFSIVIIYSFVRGKRVLSIFPPLNSVKIMFRAKYASGHSRKSWFTKLSGCKNCLDIVITDKELWVKCNILYADVAAKADMVHRIPINAILKTETNGRKIIIDFVGEEYEHKQIVIKLRNRESFLNTLKLIQDYAAA